MTVVAHGSIMKEKILPKHWVKILVGFTALFVAIGMVLKILDTEWSSGCAETKRPPTKNVILLIVDTLRVDHLGCYGYHRKTSPKIDAFAKHSTRYPLSFASSPWTLPTHASLFTGKFPYEHGAHTHLTKAKKRGVRENNISSAYPLSREHHTLAEFLAKTGYKTGAIVANTIYLSKRWKLDQGFEYYKAKKTRANQLNRLVLKWLDKVKDESFFLFINYMDTHRVYNTTPRPGLLPTPAIRDRGQLLEQLKEIVMHPEKGKVFPTVLAKKVIDQYDTAIANVDKAIGRLFRYLKKHKLYDNTMIVLTSDHGEFFGEHRLVEHSKDVYQEVIHVPLLFKQLNQRKGAVSPHVISSVDIPGMIVRSLGEDMREKGSELFERVSGNHPVIAENYYTRSIDLSHPVWGQRFMRIRAVLYDFPYKYILSSDGQDEMYHIENDKTESHNLVKEEIARGDKYRRELSQYVEPNWRRYRPPVPMQLRETKLEQMRELGYIK